MRLFTLIVRGSPRADNNEGGQADSVGNGNDSMADQKNGMNSIRGIHDHVAIQNKHNHSLNGNTQIVSCSNDIHETFEAVK